jgi:hypothetical protein
MKTRQRLLEGMYEPPPELLALPRASLEVLRTALPAGDKSRREGKW